MANAREATQRTQRQQSTEKTAQSSDQRSYLDRAFAPGLEGLNGPLGGPTSPFYGGTVESQAAMVSRSNAAQQQATMSDIGLVQGNRHMQRLVAHLQAKPSGEELSGDPYAVEDEAASAQVMATPASETPLAQDPDQVQRAIQRWPDLKQRGTLSRAAFLPLMPKLSVSEPGDPYEQEADAVADQVMKAPAPAKPALPTENAVPKDGAEAAHEQLSTAEVTRVLKNLGPNSHSGVSRYASDGVVRTHAARSFARLPGLQRLTVSEPGDAYEVEADAVAGEVMKLPAPATPPPPPDAGDDDNNTNAQSLNRAAARLQADGGSRDVDAGVEQDVNSLKGLGQPLPESERDFFESRMGYDFGNVRIHTGGKAVQTARDLSARAYAVGTDIAFGQGEYAPGTGEGRRLMAHELTHVVQQGGAGIKEAPEQPAQVTPVEPDTAAREAIARDVLAREMDSHALHAMIEQKLAEARAEAQQMESSWRSRVLRLVRALQAQRRKAPIPDMNRMNGESIQFRERVRAVVAEAAGHMWKEYKLRVVLPLIAEVVAKSKSTDSTTVSASDLKIKSGDYPEYEAMFDTIGEKSILLALRRAFRHSDLEKEIGTLITIPKEESAKSSAAGEPDTAGDASKGAGAAGAASDDAAQSQDQAGAAIHGEDEAAPGSQEGAAAQTGEAEEAVGAPAASTQPGDAKDARAQKEGAAQDEKHAAMVAEEAATAQAEQEAAANAMAAGEEDRSALWSEDKLVKPSELRQQSLPEARQTFSESVTEMSVVGENLGEALTDSAGQFSPEEGQAEAEHHKRMAEEERARAEKEAAMAEARIKQENAAKTESARGSLTVSQVEIQVDGQPVEVEMAPPEKTDAAEEGVHADGETQQADEQGKKSDEEKAKAEVDLKSRIEATDAIAETLGTAPEEPEEPDVDDGELDDEKQKIEDESKDAEKEKQEEDEIADLPVDEPVFDLQTPNPTVVFRKATPGGTKVALGAETEGQIAQLQTTGAPLPKEEQAFFESRMGQDLSGVRVHTGSEANQLNRTLQSDAFTVSNHIAFAEGKYQPGTEGGRRLMAHELAHVRQGGPQLKGWGFDWKAWARRILKFVQAIVNAESLLLGVLQFAKSMALSMLERLKTRLLDALKTGDINAINMQMLTDELTVENLEQSFDAALQADSQQSGAEVTAEGEAKAAETEAQSESDVAALEAKQQEDEAALQAEQQAAEAALTTDAQMEEEKLRAAEAQAEADVQTQQSQAETESQTKVDVAETQIETDVEQLQGDAQTLQTDTDEKVRAEQETARGKLDEAKQQANEKFEPEAVAEQINLKGRLEEAKKVSIDRFPAFKARLYNEIVGEAQQLWTDFKTSVIDATVGEIQTAFQDLQTSVTDAWKGLQEQGKALMTAAQTMLKDVQKEITGIWTAVTDKVNALKSGLKQMADQAWATLQGKATQLWTDLQGKAIQAWNNLKTQAVQVWNNLKAKATEFWNNVKGMFTGGMDKLKALGSQFLGNLKDTVKGALTKLKDKALASLKKMAQDLAKKVGEQILKNVASATAQTGASVVAVGVTSLKVAPPAPFVPTEAARMVGQTIQSGVQNLMALGQNAVQSLTQLLTNGQKFLGELLKTGQQATSTLQGFGNQMLGTLKSQATSAWDWLKTQGTNALTNLATRAQTAADKLSKMGENAWNNLKGYGEQAWNSLKTFGEKAWGSLETFGGNMQSLFEKGWTKVQTLWANRESLITEGAGKLLEWGKNIVVEQVAGFLNLEPREIYNIFTTAIKPQADQELLALGTRKVTAFIQSLFGAAGGGAGGGATVQTKHKPGATVSRTVQRAMDEVSGVPTPVAPIEAAPVKIEKEEAAPVEEKIEPDAAVAGENEEKAKEGEEKVKEAEEEKKKAGEKAKKEAGEKVAGEEEKKDEEGEEIAGEATNPEEKALAQRNDIFEAPMEPELPEEKVPQVRDEAAGVNASLLGIREAKLWSRIDTMVNKLESQDKQMVAQATAAGGISRKTLARAGAGTDDVGGAPVSSGVESQIAGMQGGGSPLPDADRGFFEQRMGADFSGVRVHTGGAAEATSQDLQARAYTVGSDIAFNAGEYQPGTDAGRRLMAHELTHVVQQGGGQQASGESGQVLPQVQRSVKDDAKVLEVLGRAPGSRIAGIIGLDLPVTDPVWDRLVETWAQFAQDKGAQFIGLTTSMAEHWNTSLKKVGDRLLPAVLAKLEEQPSVKLQLLLGSWDQGGNKYVQDILSIWANLWKDGVLSAMEANTTLWDDSIARLKSELIKAACNALNVEKDDLMKALNFVLMTNWEAGGKFATAKIVEIWQALAKTEGFLDMLNGPHSGFWLESLKKLTGDEKTTLFTSIAATLTEPHEKARFVVRYWDEGGKDHQESIFIPAWKAIAQLEGFVDKVGQEPYASLLTDSRAKAEREVMMAIAEALGETKSAAFFIEIGYEQKSWFGSLIGWVKSKFSNLSELLAMAQKFGELLVTSKAVIKKIVADPIDFCTKLFNAVTTGLGNFASKIGDYLKEAFFTWLKSILQKNGITSLPTDWDLKSILGMVAQVLGLDYDSIREQAMKHKNLAAIIPVLETCFDVITTLKNEGLAGLWNWVKGKFDDLKNQALDAMKDMLMTQVIKAGIAWLIKTLGGPVGAIVQMLQSAYGLIVWFQNNAKELLSLFESVVNTAKDIAEGGKNAAMYVERALADALVPAIDFLAQQLQLGKLFEKIRKVLDEKIRKPIANAVDAVLVRVDAFVGKIAKLLGLGGQDGEDGEGDDDDAQVGKVVKFSAKEEEHKLWVKVDGAQGTLMVASHDPMPVADKLTNCESQESQPDGENSEGGESPASIVAAARPKLTEADQNADKLAEKKAAVDGGQPAFELEKGSSELEQAQSDLETKEEELKEFLKKLFELGESRPEVIAGLKFLHQEEEQYLIDGAIVKQNAEAAALATQEQHPVFKSITVIDGGKSWDYEYVASPATIADGKTKDPLLQKFMDIAILEEDAQKKSKEWWPVVKEFIEQAQFSDATAEKLAKFFKAAQVDQKTAAGLAMFANVALAETNDPEVMAKFAIAAKVATYNALGMGWFTRFVKIEAGNEASMADFAVASEVKYRESGEPIGTFASKLNHSVLPGNEVRIGKEYVSYAKIGDKTTKIATTMADFFEKAKDDNKKSLDDIINVGKYLTDWVSDFFELIGGNNVSFSNLFDLCLKLGEAHAKDLVVLAQRLASVEEVSFNDFYTMVDSLGENAVLFVKVGMKQDDFGSFIRICKNNQDVLAEITSRWEKIKTQIVKISSDVQDLAGKLDSRIVTGPDEVALFTPEKVTEQLESGQWTIKELESLGPRVEEMETKYDNKEGEKAILSEVLGLLSKIHSKWTAEHSERVGKLVEEIAGWMADQILNLTKLKQDYEEEQTRLQQELEKTQTQAQNGAHNQEENQSRLNYIQGELPVIETHLDALLPRLEALKGENERFTIDRFDNLAISGELHDIGKLFKVPSEVVEWRGSYDFAKQKAMGKHTSEEVIKDIKGVEEAGKECGNISEETKLIIRYHHNFPDPDKEHITLADNIKYVIGVFQLSDVLDALLSNRPYKKGKVDGKETVDKVASLFHSGLDQDLFNAMTYDGALEAQIDKFLERVPDFFPRENVK